MRTRTRPSTRLRLGVLPALAVLVVAMLAVPAHATWSILIVDTRTGEIAVGSATCLTGFDLRAWTPVVQVGVGAATAQSAIDSGAVNRMRIWQELQMGTPLAQILTILAGSDPSHQTRQYGMVDVSGDTLTFSGTGAAAWAGGVTGQDGTLFYAVQGNILTGSPVVDMAEQAILSTPGDLPAKLMAAMEAARSMGGDGRCSCAGTPTSCGSPPPVFTKSAHIGYMIVARLGDIDGTCTPAPGCATGSYYLNLNVPFQSAGSLDPVLQMQASFATWRTGWIGRPDHNLSTVDLAAPWLPADGAAQTTATVTVRDWQGNPVTAPGLVVTPALDPASTASVSLGAVADLGGGVYSFSITAGATPGEAILRVTVDDGGGAVLVSPATKLTLLPCACGDCDGSGGAPDVLDAFEAARIAVTLVVPSAAQIHCCDVEAIAGISVTDALVLGQLSVGIPVSLTCP